MNARDDGHETAASHLRNALQVLEGLAWNPLDATTFSLALAGLQSRIRRALVLVEGRPLITYELTPAGRRELGQTADVARPKLEARLRIVLEPIACRFCGCQQDSACAIPVDQLSEDARNAVDLWRYEHGLELTDTVACWWVSLNPPVCSKPSCVAQLEEIRRARAAAITGADRARTFASLPPEQGGPV